MPEKRGSERPEPTSPTSKALRGFVERPPRAAKPKPDKPKKNYKLLAEQLSEGVPIYQAMLKAGYSENVAKRGRASIPDAVWKNIPRKTKRLLAKGKHLAENPDVAKHLVLGRLGENAERGRDAGSTSAKALGNWRELDMFTPESQTGIIVLTPPAALAAMTPEEKKKFLEMDDEPAVNPATQGPGEYTMRDGQVVRVR